MIDVDREDAADVVGVVDGDEGGGGEAQREQQRNDAGDTAGAEKAIDQAYEIPDAEALPIVFDLLQHEGLCLGGSTGINVAGAIRLAKEMGPGHTIVTVLCDYGNRYQSKLFNPDFLREKGLPVPPWLAEQRAAVPVPFA